MNLELTNLDQDCVPALKAYKTVEEIVKKCFLKIYEYRPEYSGWYGEYVLVNGAGLTAMVHGTVNATLSTQVAKLGKIELVKFHHAKQIGLRDATEPWLEVWTDEDK
ncbi:hypothetical protein EFP33_08465 [Lactobacillus johnsonii]|nr:hypothetical protein [Lactobacillus johnsonii]